MHRITAINEDIGSEDEDDNQVTKEAEVYWSQHYTSGCT